MRETERLRDIVWRSGWSDLRQPLEATARELDVEIFLIGGYVRDLLLERTPRDFDLTVAGDGVACARALARRAGAEVRTTERFLTAEVTLRDGRRIDVASTRAEDYERPGALPTVRPADLAADLGRRDFTVNTFALCLTATRTGELESVAAARADLAARILRPLHSRSFLDDPTRILRAVRQETRLDFHLSEDGERAAREAIESGALATVSGERLWHELEPLLASGLRGARSLRRLEALGALRGLVEGLGWSGEQEAWLQGALGELEAIGAAGGLSGPDGEPPPDSLCAQISLLAVVATAGPEQGLALAERLHLAQPYRSLLSGWTEHGESARATLAVGDARPSSVHRVLAGLSTAELLFLAGSAGEPGRAWVRRELLEFRPFRLGVRAADLLQHGATPGPAIGRALEQTVSARLDGEIGVHDELDYALGTLEPPDTSEPR